MVSKTIKKSRYLYGFLMIFIIISSISVYYFAFITSSNDLEIETSLLSEEINSRLESEIEGRLNLMGVFQEEWTDALHQGGVLNETRFYRLAPKYYNYFQGIEAISWINTSGIITWRYPDDPNSTIIGQSIVYSKDGSVNQAFHNASVNLQTSISNPKELYINSFGYVAYFPLIYNETLTGFLNLVFKIEDFIESILKSIPVSENFEIYIQDDSIPIYNTTNSIDFNNKFCNQKSFQFLDRRWNISVIGDSDKLFKASPLGNWNFLVILIIFIIFTILLLHFLLSQTEKITKTLHEKEKIQKQLIQSQKMDAIGQLAGGVAHDFNNILTVIGGFTELALLSSKDNKEIQEYLHEIQNSGEMAKKLTSQLLAFGRKQNLIPEKIFLDDLVLGNKMMIQRLIGENIELDIRNLSQMKENYNNNNKNNYNNKLIIEADPGQIQQILLNLAINSKDAMPNGGRLTISTSQEYLDQNQLALYDIHLVEGDYALLQVSDTGKGMDKKVMEHIFEPFFTTKEVGKGTGLGLSTVFGIIKQNHGYIHVYSEVNNGTTFKIYFPLVKEVSLSMKEKKLQLTKLNLNSLRFVIVEDREEIINFITSILKSRNAKVISFTNGADALQYFYSIQDGIIDAKFDFMICDVIMPKMGGKELLEKLPEKLGGLKILFISGYVGEDLPFLLKTHKNHKTTFLQKPFGVNDFLEKILELSID
ncbi:MAG: ATP-binding protein [Promethearchaeota archaeon]